MPHDPPRDGSSKNLKRSSDFPMGEVSTNTKRARENVIEISSDEDDHEQDSKKRNLPKPTSKPSSDATLHANVPKPTPEMQNREERMKLESERLARQRAREQLLTNPATSSDSALPRAITERDSDRLDASQSPPFKNYWNSTIKTTSHRSYPDTSRTIRIDDIIGPRTQIKMAVVSSYVVDLPWIHGLFEPKTPVLVIRHHAEPGTFKVNERENLFLCHPPMLTSDKGKARAGCMHIKLRQSIQMLHPHS